MPSFWGVGAAGRLSLPAAFGASIATTAVSAHRLGNVPDFHDEPKHVVVHTPAQNKYKFADNYEYPSRFRFPRKKRMARRRYRRTRRRRRSRMVRRAGMSHSLPRYYRMKHVIHYQDNFDFTAGADGIGYGTKRNDGVLNADASLELRLKANEIHDPITVGGTARTALSPTWFDEMAAIYSRYKVNNVYIVADVCRLTPKHTSDTSGAATDPLADAHAPDIVALYACASSSAVDGNPTLRHGAKSSYLTHAGQITRLVHRVNPATILGLKNSFSQEDYVVETPTGSPDTPCDIRLSCHPFHNDTTSSPAYWFSIRVYYDVTWTNPIKVSHDA